MTQKVVHLAEAVEDRKRPYAGSERPRIVPSRTRTLASVVELFLDPLVAVAGLFLVALAAGESLSLRYAILALIAFLLKFPGDNCMGDSVRRVWKKSILDTLVLAGVLTFFAYAGNCADFFPKNVIYAWFICLPFAQFGMQMLMRHLIPGVLVLSNTESRAVICGHNDIGFQLARVFDENRYLGIKLIGFFDDRRHAAKVGGFTLLGKLEGLADYVKSNNIDRVYVALPMASEPRILSLLDDLKDTTASIYFVPDIFVTDLIQGRAVSLGGMPVVAVCDTPFGGINGIVKRIEDIVLSSLILALISPVLLAVALGVKLSSPGPVIFRQRRYGLNGKEILVYKFRSMTVTEDGPNVPQATRNDVRITRFGAFIRRTSLDELPQFINVLQGRMSIVGPRPHAVAHNELYRTLIKGYMVRHKVKPGITGLAQVSGYRGETDTVEKMENRIASDLEYLRNWSLSLDIWIIIRTILLVVRDKSAY